jgi:hypothetical protein
MHARATLLEIDTVRVGVDAAVETFRSEVLPKLREEPGYEGVIVLSSPEGKGLIVSFWSTAEAANTERSGYSETLAEYMTLFRSPPGREHYEVALAELPATAAP